MIRVIVKGNASVASAAAERHGLQFILRNEIPAKSPGQEDISVGYVQEMRHLEKVAAWFVEDMESRIPFKGFPRGSLLHYSFT